MSAYNAQQRDYAMDENIGDGFGSHSSPTVLIGEFYQNGANGIQNAPRGPDGAYQSRSDWLVGGYCDPDSTTDQYLFNFDQGYAWSNTDARYPRPDSMSGYAASQPFWPPISDSLPKDAAITNYLLSTEPTDIMTNVGFPDQIPKTFGQVTMGMLWPDGRYDSAWARVKTYKSDTLLYSWWEIPIRTNDHLKCLRRAMRAENLCMNWDLRWFDGSGMRYVKPTDLYISDDPIQRTWSVNGVDTTVHTNFLTFMTTTTVWKDKYGESTPQGHKWEYDFPGQFGSHLFWQRPVSYLNRWNLVVTWYSPLHCFVQSPRDRPVMGIKTEVLQAAQTLIDALKPDIEAVKTLSKSNKDDTKVTKSRIRTLGEKMDKAYPMLEAIVLGISNAALSASGATQVQHVLQAFGFIRSFLMGVADPTTAPPLQNYPHDNGHRPLQTLFEFVKQFNDLAMRTEDQDFAIGKVISLVNNVIESVEAITDRVDKVKNLALTIPTRGMVKQSISLPEFIDQPVIARSDDRNLDGINDSFLGARAIPESQRFRNLKRTEYGPIPRNDKWVREDGPNKTQYSTQPVVVNIPAPMTTNEPVEVPGHVQIPVTPHPVHDEHDEPDLVIKKKQKKFRSTFVSSTFK